MTRGLPMTLALAHLWANLLLTAATVLAWPLVEVPVAVLLAALQVPLWLAWLAHLAEARENGLAAGSAADRTAG